MNLSFVKMNCDQTVATCEKAASTQANVRKGRLRVGQGRVYMMEKRRACLLRLHAAGTYAHGHGQNLSTASIISTVGRYRPST